MSDANSAAEAAFAQWWRDARESDAWSLLEIFTAGFEAGQVGVTPGAPGDWRAVATTLYEELSKWGFGDFHYGNQPRDQKVLMALAVYDAADSGVGVTPRATETDEAFEVRMAHALLDQLGAPTTTYNPFDHCDVVLSPAGRVQYMLDPKNLGLTRDRVQRMVELLDAEIARGVGVTQPPAPELELFTSDYERIRNWYSDHVVHLGALGADPGLDDRELIDRLALLCERARETDEL